MERKYKQGEKHPHLDKLFWRYQKDNNKVCERWVTPDIFAKRRADSSDAWKRYIEKPEKSQAKKEKKKIYRSHPLIKEHEKNIKKTYLSDPVNRRKSLDTANKYQKNRRLSDPMFKIRHSIRTRVNAFLRKINFKKQSNSSTLIGCTMEFLKEYLESLFTDGMDWDNYGRGKNKWHIDHIKPLSLAQTEEDLIRLSHWSNLQPLWMVDNIRKGNR